MILAGNSRLLNVSNYAIYDNKNVPHDLLLKCVKDDGGDSAGKILQG